MQEAKTFQFGVFADPHYADKDSDSERYFRRSIDKVNRCLDKFNQYSTDFVVCLGDFIDFNKDGSDSVAQLQEIRNKVVRRGYPLYSVLGNHDVIHLSRETLARELALPNINGYYAFSHKGWRFIVLDTNYSPEGTAYTGEDMQWDNCVVDPRQVQWLRKELDLADGPVIVLAHGNLEPRTVAGELDPHIIRNTAEITEILQNSGKVRLVLQGHYHRGCTVEYGGIPYVTLRAIVEGPENNAALVVTCSEEGEVAWLQQF